MQGQAFIPPLTVSALQETLTKFVQGQGMVSLGNRVTPFNINAGNYKYDPDMVAACWRYISRTPDISVKTEEKAYGPESGRDMKGMLLAEAKALKDLDDAKTSGAKRMTLSITGGQSYGQFWAPYPANEGDVDMKYQTGISPRRKVWHRQFNFEAGTWGLDHHILKGCLLSWLRDHEDYKSAYVLSGIKRFMGYKGQAIPLENSVKRKVVTDKGVIYKRKGFKRFKKKKRYTSTKRSYTKRGRRRR